jgi:hypothetical protein
MTAKQVLFRDAARAKVLRGYFDPPGGQYLAAG